MKDTVKEGKISVAIVTAREDSQTTYEDWCSVRHAFLAGKPTWKDAPLGNAHRRLPLLTGEFGALLAACLDHQPVMHHVEYQIRALALQTHIPDHVFVVSRLPPPKDWDTDKVPWEAPMVSRRELELAPEAACHHLVGPTPRSTAHSFGCADKNTALILCETEYLIVLDDCCLPGFGLVEHAFDACHKGQILMLQHRQLYLPKENQTFNYADSNTDLTTGHRVFGVFAAPLRYLLDVNGWNTDLDGQRGGLDAELLARMDIYTKMRDVQYVTTPFARVYEIEHSYPWSTESNSDTPVAGWRAPGPLLRDIREKVQLQLYEEPTDGEDEDEEDEDED